VSILLCASPSNNHGPLRASSGFDFYWPVVVAVISMGMVEVAVDEVVDVVAVRDRRMAAVGSVHVLRVMPGALMSRRAFVGVLSRDGDDVVVNAITFLVLKMALLQVVHVSVVLDRRMPASNTVPMSGCSRHVNSPYQEEDKQEKPLFAVYRLPTTSPIESPRRASRSDEHLYPTISRNETVSQNNFVDHAPRRWPLVMLMFT
jgi:hypothetical protein